MRGLLAKQIPSTLWQKFHYPFAGLHLVPCTLYPRNRRWGVYTRHCELDRKIAI